MFTGTSGDHTAFGVKQLKKSDCVQQNVGKSLPAGTRQRPRRIKFSVMFDKVNILRNIIILHYFYLWYLLCQFLCNCEVFGCSGPK